jgi:hypothetical protein
MNKTLFPQIAKANRSGGHIVYITTQPEISQACRKLLIYRLAESCQQVATGLLVSSVGNRLAGTGLWQAVDNRAVR